MLTGRSWVGRAVLAGGLASVLFAACAKGNQTDLGAGGSGAGSSGAGGHHGTTGKDAGNPGTIGSPCDTDTDCHEGTCTDVGAKKYCSIPCPPECPVGSYCSIINGDSICVPDLDNECVQCNADTDCKLPTDVCLTAPAGDKFCARDCTPDGVCPNGFTCLDQPTYAGSDAGVADAGGGGGDGGTPSSMPVRWCVPNSGLSCPCNQKRDGISHACTVTNSAGTCSGTESCNGKKGTWEGCTADTPSAEVCNGRDDNCDGQVDEGDPNSLCAAAGPKPPNGNWGCDAGKCVLASCDPGWTSYPPGPPSAGCACPLETGEPNGSCATATDAGSASDTGALLMIEGTLSSAADVDFWTFDTVDTNEVSTNSYHVSITFDQPAPNDEFLMDVMRGGACSDTPSGAGAAITAYDWCVNGTDGLSPPTGEEGCGPTGTTHCADHSARYWVRVYRKLGATASCTQYKIKVAAGGGTCDFAQKCP